MSTLTNIPLENAYSTNLSGSISASALTVTLDDAVHFTLPAGQTIDIIIDPENSKRERCVVTAIDATKKIFTVTRAQPDYYGHTATAVAHSGGAKVVITDSWSIFNDIATVVNSKVDKSTGAITVYANAAARDVAIPSPTNGMQCYLTDTGKFMDYTAGAWVNRESGGTFANASTTVAGKVEEATAAQVVAKTGTGETGARLFIAPDNSALINDSTGVADAGKLPVADANGRLKASMVHLDSQSLEDDGSDNVRVKLKAGGGLTKDASGLYADTATVGVVTGEAINGSVTPQAVTVLGTRVFTNDFPCVDNTVHNYILAHDSFTAFGNADATTRCAMKITTPNIDGVITVTGLQFSIQKTLAPVDNVFIEIMDEAAGLPNAVIANGTSGDLALGGVGTAYNMMAWTFATPPTLTKNTNYWIAFRRDGVNDAANYPQLSTSTAAAGLGITTYTGSTAIWAAATASRGFNGNITYSVNLAGAMYRADANDSMRSNVRGFTVSNVAATETAYNQSFGALAIAGLTAGKDYFLDTTIGGITNSPTIADSVALVPVGSSLTTGILDIKLGVKRWTQKISGISYRLVSGAGAVDSTINFALECGFRPKKITAHVYIDDSTANEDASDIVEWTDSFLSQHIYKFTALDSSHRTVTAVSTIGSPDASAYCGSPQMYVNVTAINDTGFTFEVFQNADNTATIGDIAWAVEG